MPAEILIHAYTHDSFLKGSICLIKDSPAVWGRMEAPPDFVVVIISDTTAAQVVSFTENYKNEILYELLNSNELGRRYSLSVNPKILELEGEEAGLKQEIRDVLVDDYSATIVSYVPATATAVVDIPNTDWDALKANLKDIFEQHYIDRYVFSESDVDLALANGGTVTITKAQALNRIIDRLA